MLCLTHRITVRILKCVSILLLPLEGTIFGHHGCNWWNARAQENLAVADVPLWHFLYVLRPGEHGQKHVLGP